MGPKKKTGSGSSSRGKGRSKQEGQETEVETAQPAGSSQASGSSGVAAPREESLASSVLAESDEPASASGKKVARGRGRGRGKAAVQRQGTDTSMAQKGSDDPDTDALSKKGSSQRSVVRRSSSGRGRGRGRGKAKRSSQFELTEVTEQTNTERDGEASAQNNEATTSKPSQANDNPETDVLTKKDSSQKSVARTSSSRGRGKSKTSSDLRMSEERKESTSRKSKLDMSDKDLTMFTETIPEAVESDVDQPANAKQLARDRGRGKATSQKRRDYSETDVLRRKGSSQRSVVRRSSSGRGRGRGKARRSSDFRPRKEKSENSQNAAKSTILSSEPAPPFIMDEESRCFVRDYVDDIVKASLDIASKSAAKGATGVRFALRSSTAGAWLDEKRKKFSRRLTTLFPRPKIIRKIVRKRTVM